MKISLIMDNPESWYRDHCLQLSYALRKRKHCVTVTMSGAEVQTGDVAFYLSYEKIVPSEILARHSQNCVVHSSDLPKGRGWAPLSWQILEGSNKIKNTLFEITYKVDAGRILLQNEMEFTGYELLPELHRIQGEKVSELVIEYVMKLETTTFPPISAMGWPQKGEPTYYRKRTAEDSKLDPDRPLGEQFNLLRIVDNKRYPAYFEIDGNKYVLEIRKG